MANAATHTKGWTAKLAAVHAIHYHRFVQCLLLQLVSSCKGVKSEPGRVTSSSA